MKENKYDDEVFFEKYSQMDRSKEGLAGAGEWETLKELLPDFTGKRMLDLGCGYGWHCIYAMEHGAASAVGIDISRKMLEVARGKDSLSAGGVPVHRHGGYGVSEGELRHCPQLPGISLY